MTGDFSHTNIFSNPTAMVHVCTALQERNG